MGFVCARLCADGNHIHFIGRGHTDGDLVAFIEPEGALVMGDLLFHQHYPNIDLEAGGSIQAWPATLDNALSFSPQTVIPGHGLATDTDGVLQFQSFIEQLAAISQTVADDQLSLEATLALPSLTADEGYTEVTMAGIPIGLNREFVLRRAWEEGSGQFQRAN